MLLDHIVQDAIKNVWCAPKQDYQVVLIPARITPSYGVRGSVNILWDKVRLPTPNDTYHVFQLGHIKPKLLGLMDLSDTWTPLDKLIRDSNLVSEFYFGDGRLYPRFACFFRWDKNRNLTLAVRQYDILKDIQTARMSLRVFTNAYFNSSRWTSSETETYCNGLHINVENAQIPLQNEYHTYRDKTLGEAFAYINGVLVDDFKPTDVTVGDVVEFYYDASIYSTIKVPVNSLNTFVSDLDTETKYLIHNTQKDLNEIDFVGDMDVYLTRVNPNNDRYKGVYLGKNQARLLRNLTHQDYSLSSSMVNTYNANNSDTWDTSHPLYVNIFIRKAGIERNLIHDSSRIFELYKLENDQIEQAMVGAHAHVDVWKAANLEKSPYTSLMRSFSDNLDTKDVEETYGYNSISRILGDTPKYTELTAGWPSIKLLPAQKFNAAAYEYDAEGLLLGFWNIQNHNVYPCRNENTNLVEVVVGEADDSQDIIFGEQSVDINRIYNYRAYKCMLIEDEPTFDWIDITDTDEVTIDGGTLAFNLDINNWYTAVLSDKKILSYSEYVSPLNGYYKFNVKTAEDHGGGLEVRDSSIPPMRLDVWMGDPGKYLIEGLDYIVNWPEVYISNKCYCVPGSSQKVTIRAVGFANSDMSMEKPREYGFIKHGYLSNNKRYDIRDDVVLSFIVDGKLIPRDEAVFFEDNDGVAVSDFNNGRPYAIKETIVPIRDSFSEDTYEMRSKARNLDDIISNYMSQYYNELDISGPVPITEYYRIYSIFMSRIIEMTSNGYPTEEDLTQHYSNSQIDEWLDDERDLLLLDITNDVDTEFVAIDPHPYSGAVTVTPAQYGFIKRVNDLYFDGRITLSGFFNVAA